MDTRYSRLYTGSYEVPDKKLVDSRASSLDESLHLINPVESVSSTSTHLHDWEHDDKRYTHPETRSFIPSNVYSSSARGTDNPSRLTRAVSSHPASSHPVSSLPASSASGSLERATMDSASSSVGIYSHNQRPKDADYYPRQVSESRLRTTTMSESSRISRSDSAEELKVARQPEPLTNNRDSKVIDKDRGVQSRVQSLDAFRGLVIVTMILVDDAGSLFNHAIGHAFWDGIGLAGARLFHRIESKNLLKKILHVVA